MMTGGKITVDRQEDKVGAWCNNEESFVDKRHCTIVAPRQDFIKNMTTDALQEDTTIIIRGRSTSWE